MSDNDKTLLSMDNLTRVMKANDALFNVQKTLIANKGQFNSFGKYHYRSCEDILEALKKVMPEGATVTMQDDIRMIGDRYYIEATAKFNYNGVSIESKALAREASEKKGMDASQVTGSTSSYARKYALNGLFCIDDNKDADDPVETNTNKNNYQSKNNNNQKPKSGPNEIIKGIIETLLNMKQENNRKEAIQLISELMPDEKKEIAKHIGPATLQWMKSLSKNPIPKEAQ
jgi:hypothetical protein